ncbi:DNA methyltransferase [Phaeobacter sp. G2]|nr:DNA methyltransferase [Phaeobacter sp. G2]
MIAGYRRKEVIGGCTLYLGDMRDVLPRLPEKAALCATDAPYKLTSGGKANQSMSGKFALDRYDNSGDLMASIPWNEMGGPIYRALKSDADAYVMCNDKHFGAAQIAFQGVGFKFHNLLTWDKGAPTRAPFYMKNQEFTQYLWKGRARRPNYGGAKQSFACARPKGVDWHPTPKPTSLMALYILQSSQPGDLVLEPFMGAGATVLAALAFGRRAVGVEIEDSYFEKSCARIEAAHLAGFGEVRDEWERDRSRNNLKGLCCAA